MDPYRIFFILIVFIQRVYNTLHISGANLLHCYYCSCTRVEANRTQEIQSGKIDAYLFLGIKPYQSLISIDMDQWILIHLYPSSILSIFIEPFISLLEKWIKVKEIKLNGV